MVEGSDGTAGIREDPVAGIERTDGFVVVSLAGELDLYNASTVREALLACCAESPERLIVDLSAVKFIDSTALGVLIEARTRLREPEELPARGAWARDAARARDLRPRPAFRRARSVEQARGAALTESAAGRPASLPPVNESERILEPAQLRRYADAIVKAGLGVAPGDTLVVQAEPAHRELAIEVVAAGYRAGATIVELQYYDPLVTRARLLNGRDESLGAFSPWAKRRMQELAKPTAARAAITGESEPGYLDGIPPKKIGLDFSRAAEQSKAFRRANLDMRARWTGAGWPTDFWAGQVYPDLVAARRQAPARAGLPLVLPAHRRGRQGLDRVAQAHDAHSRAAPRS